MTLSTALAAALCAAAPQQPEVLVPFASAESAVRLERSRHKVDFFALANHFEGQQNVAMCGPTSAVIVLNALRARSDAVPKPRDESLLPAEYWKLVPPGFNPVFDRYTQGTFFDARFRAVKARDTFFGLPGKDGARDPGLQLRQLHEILLGHGLDSALRVVGDPADEPRQKAELVENLGAAGDYVIVAYSREALGQPGGGHISPVAAYDAQSDSFLIMDVNPNQGRTWIWAPARRLFEAMRTRDQAENRGFLLVREGRAPPPQER